MIKKIIFIFSLSCLCCLFSPLIISKANTPAYIQSHWNTVIYLDCREVSGNGYQYLIYGDADYDHPFAFDNGYITWNYSYNFNVEYYMINAPLLDYPDRQSNGGQSTHDFYCYGVRPSVVQGYFDWNEPVPEPPEPGVDWVHNMWLYILSILGIDDPFSEDVEELVGGPGQAGHVQIVTPTPTPSPTPVSLVITDNNGDPVYTINNFNITGGDSDNGSDFDIFEVDMTIGDGGTSNPRDGLNSVMDSNNDYLHEVDISPVSGSFSVLPSDWYLLIGVLISFPVIAGFISKLLK